MLVRTIRHFKTRYLATGSFAANVITLMTGIAIAQAILIVSSPILTRVYTPEQFGVFASYMAVTSIISTIANGRYELAILLPKKDEEAINIVALSLGIAVLVSLMTWVSVLIFNDSFDQFLGTNKVNNWLYLIPISVLILGIYQVFNYWLNRKLEYKRISSSRILQSVVVSGISLGFGLFDSLNNGLILGYLIGQGVATITLGWQIWKADKDYLNYISANSIKTQAKRYINFPKYLIFAHLLNTSSAQIPVILINSLFSSEIAGFFSISIRTIGLPMAIIARSIGDVFRQQAAIDFASSGQCYEIYIKTFKQLLSISVLPFLILMLFAKNLFGFVFGENWLVAGEYAQILSIPFFLQFISSPLSVMFIIAEKPRLDLMWQILFFAMTLSSILIGSSMANSYISICLLSLSDSILHILNFFLTLNFSKGNK